MRFLCPGFLATLAAAASLATSSVQAAMLNVPNFSFESPPQSSGSFTSGSSGDSNSALAKWDVGGAGGSAGVQDNNGIYAVVPDGHQWAYLNTGATGDSMSLTLTPSTNTLPLIVAGDTYTLDVDLGNRNSAAANATIEILANGVPVASNTVSTGSFSQGFVFFDFSATLSGAQSALLGGQQLSISIISTDTADAFSQLNIDNVRLSVVPEPASLTLLGSALIGIAAMAIRRRRAG